MGPLSNSAPGKVAGVEAQRLVDAGALLLDVRTPEEFAEGHVPGALNIPVQVLGQRLADLGAKEREVVVYCKSGGRSARAAAELRQVGYTVHDLGGMGNWGG